VDQRRVIVLMLMVMGSMLELAHETDGVVVGHVVVVVGVNVGPGANARALRRPPRSDESSWTCRMRSRAAAINGAMEAGETKDQKKT
jgi:hypothetical protein